jgi:hypothetical protein
LGIKRTLRERKFIKAYIENNGNATEAYLVLHPEAKRETAGELGYRMLKKVDISNDELLNEMGMTDAYLNQKLNEGLEATKELVNIGTVDDYPTRQKYLDMAYKLKAKYPAERHELTGAGGGPITYKELIYEELNKGENGNTPPL